jgi:hypothetical protein
LDLFDDGVEEVRFAALAGEFMDQAMDEVGDAHRVRTSWPDQERRTKAYAGYLA